MFLKSEFSNEMDIFPFFMRIRENKWSESQQCPENNLFEVSLDMQREQEMISSY